MLVLSRQLGETIHIGTDITITVTDIDRGKIRLGIVAPRDYPILRAELLDAMHPANVCLRAWSQKQAQKHVTALKIPEPSYRDLGRHGRRHH